MTTVPAMTMFDFEKVKVNGIINPTDGTVRNNLNVDVSLGDNVLETTTTYSNGKYNLEFFIPSGSYFYVPMIRCGNDKKAVFDVIQDSPNQVILQVIETNLSITSTKDILSFQDNDTTTINATLTYGTTPQPIEGEEVCFEIKDNQNNIIDTQVSTTDSNGIASIVYESQGIGDITVSASVGGFLTKTYVIYDDWYYDTGSTNKGHWTIPTQATVTFGQNGIVAIGNTTSDVGTALNINYPTDYSIECEITEIGFGHSNYSAGLICSEVCIISRNTPKIQLDCFETSQSQSFNGEVLTVGDVIKFTKQNGTVSVYRNNTLLKSYIVSNNNGFRIRTYNNWKIGIKNLEIKPLSSIDISVDNPILSFIDSTQENPQTATLTATLNPIVQGKTVKIYKDDTLVATEQTDSQGQVSYEYTSQGVGDVEFKFECGTVSKTYSIKDGIYYNSNVISSNKSLSVANIPTNFKLFFKVNTKSSSTNNGAYLKLGSDANNCIYIGQLGNNGASGIWVKVNGTNVIENYSVILPVGENLLEYSYDNGVQTFKHETDSITVNNSQITSRDYLETFIINNYVKELLIMPLQSMDINVDNPILSFADGDTATLTATVLPVTQGKTVKIYKDDILVATEQTDSQGRVSYTYESQGVGDVEFRFECGLLIQRYEVTDCYRYYPSIPSDSYITLDDENIPSEFIMSFTAKTLARTSSICWAIFNNEYRVGIADSGGYCGIVNHSNGQWITKLNNQLPLNTDKEIICKYENGTWTVSWDNYSISNSNLSAPNILKFIQTTPNMEITDFKIKPL